MTRQPREHADDKGFWDGGPKGHGSDQESSGRNSGAPGSRTPDRTGFRTDIDPSSPERQHERTKSIKGDDGGSD